MSAAASPSLESITVALSCARQLSAFLKDWPKDPETSSQLSCLEDHLLQLYWKTIKSSSSFKQNITELLNKQLDPSSLIADLQISQKTSADACKTENVTPPRKCNDICPEDEDTQIDESIKQLVENDLRPESDLITGKVKSADEKNEDQPKVESQVGPEKDESQVGPEKDESQVGPEKDESQIEADIDENLLSRGDYVEIDSGSESVSKDRGDYVEEEGVKGSSPEASEDENENDKSNNDKSSDASYSEEDPYSSDSDVEVLSNTKSDNLIELNSDDNVPDKKGESENVTQTIQDADSKSNEKTMHPDRTIKRSEKKHVCSACHFADHDLAVVQDHFKSQHLEKQNMMRVKTIPHNVVKKNTKLYLYPDWAIKYFGNKYTCAICLFADDRLKDVVNHIKVHQSEQARRVTKNLDLLNIRYEMNLSADHPFLRLYIVFPSKGSVSMEELLKDDSSLHLVACDLCFEMIPEDLMDFHQDSEHQHSCTICDKKMHHPYFMAIHLLWQHFGDLSESKYNTCVVQTQELIKKRTQQECGKSPTPSSSLPQVPPLVPISSVSTSALAPKQNTSLLKPITLAPKQNTSLLKPITLAPTMLKITHKTMKMTPNILRKPRNTRHIAPKIFNIAPKPFSVAPDQSPSVPNQPPSVSNQSPSVSNQSPSAPNQSPSVSNQSPSVSNQSPSAPNQSPSVSNQPPSVFNQSPSVSNQSPSIPNQPPSVFNQSPSVSNQSLSAPNQSPSVPNQPPSVSNQSPSIPNQPPSVFNQSPSVSNQSLSVPNQSLSVPDQPTSVLNQRTLVSNQSPLFPNQSTFVPNQSPLFLNQSTFVPNQSPLFLNQSTLGPNQSTIFLNQSTLAPKKAEIPVKNSIAHLQTSDMANHFYVPSWSHGLPPRKPLNTNSNQMSPSSSQAPMKFMSSQPCAFIVLPPSYNISMQNNASGTQANNIITATPGNTLATLTCLENLDESQTISDYTSNVNVNIKEEETHIKNDEALEFTNAVQEFQDMSNQVVLELQQPQLDKSHLLVQPLHLNESELSVQQQQLGESNSFVPQIQMDKSNTLSHQPELNKSSALVQQVYESNSLVEKARLNKSGSLVEEAQLETSDLSVQESQHDESKLLVEESQLSEPDSFEITCVWCKFQHINHRVMAEHIKMCYQQKNKGMPPPTDVNGFHTCDTCNFRARFWHVYVRHCYYNSCGFANKRKNSTTNGDKLKIRKLDNNQQAYEDISDSSRETINIGNSKQGNSGTGDIGGESKLHDVDAINVDTALTKINVELPSRSSSPNMDNEDTRAATDSDDSEHDLVIDEKLGNDAKSKETANDALKQNQESRKAEDNSDKNSQNHGIDNGNEDEMLVDRWEKEKSHEVIEDSSVKCKTEIIDIDYDMLQDNASELAQTRGSDDLSIDPVDMEYSENNVTRVCPSNGCTFSCADWKSFQSHLLANNHYPYKHKVAEFETLKRCTKCDFITYSANFYHFHNTSCHSENANQMYVSCFLCGFGTFKVSVLRKHMQFIHRSGHIQVKRFPKHIYLQDCCIKGGKVICNKCNFSARSAELMDTHRLMHGGTCSQCTYSTKYKMYLTLHAEMHTAPHKQYYLCKLCVFATYYEVVFVKHCSRRHSHNTCLLKDNSKRFICSKCSFSTDSIRDHHSHERSHTNSEACPQTSPNLAKQPGPKVTLAEAAATSRAGGNPMTPLTHSNHVAKSRWENGYGIGQSKIKLKEKFWCKFCSFSSSEKKALKNHVKSHHKQLIQNPQLSTPSESKKQSLDSRQNTSSGFWRIGKMFKCIYCGHATEDFVSMQTHLKTHKDQESSASEHKKPSKSRGRRRRRKLKSQQNSNIVDSLKKNLHKQSGEDSTKTNLVQKLSQPKDNHKNVDKPYTKTVHKISTMFKFSCSKCSYRTNSTMCMQIHEKTHQPPTSYRWMTDVPEAGRTADTKFNCGQCKFGTNSVTDMQKHTKLHPLSTKHAETIKMCARADEAAAEKSPDAEVMQGKFLCALCEFKTDSRTSLMIHKKIHSLRSDYQTKPSSFGNDDKYRSGYFVSLDNVPSVTKISLKFQYCDLCVYKTTSQTEMIEHKLQHVVPQQKKKLICGTCKLQFVYERDLNNHVKNAHTKKTEYNVNVCQRCKLVCKSVEELNVHLKCHYFYCTICIFKSSSKSHLQKHVNQHETGGEFSCSQCKFIGSNQGMLIEHELYHSSFRTNVCKLCKLRFYTERSLKQHLETYHQICEQKEQKLLMVSEKDSEMSKENTQQKHATVNHPISESQSSSKTGNPSSSLASSNSPKRKASRFSNNETSKSSYDEKSDIYDHYERGNASTNVIGDDKLNGDLCKCSICPFKTLDKQEMMDHRDRHEYRCNLCIFKSMTLRGMQEHQNNHLRFTGYKCQLCPQVSRCKASLLSHYKVHSSDKEHVCPDCKFRFENAIILLQHQKSFHSGEPEVNTGDYSIYIKPKSEEITAPKMAEAKAAVKIVEKFYHCKVCMYITNIPGLLTRHTKLVHQGHSGLNTAIVKLVDCYGNRRADRFKKPLPHSSGMSRKSDVLAKKVDSEHRMYYCHRCIFRSYNRHLVRIHQVLFHVPGVDHAVVNARNKSNTSCKSASKKKISKCVEVKIKIGSTYSCKFCKFSALHNNELNSHIRDKHLDRILLCSVCPFVTTGLRLLELHLERHQKRQAIQCPECTYSCSKQPGMNLHMTWHSLVGKPGTSGQGNVPIEGTSTEDEATTSDSMQSLNYTKPSAAYRKHVDGEVLALDISKITSTLNIPQNTDSSESHEILGKQYSAHNDDISNASNPGDNVTQEMVCEFQVGNLDGEDLKMDVDPCDERLKDLEVDNTPGDVDINGRVDGNDVVMEGIDENITIKVESNLSCGLCEFKTNEVPLMQDHENWHQQSMKNNSDVSPLGGDNTVLIPDDFLMDIVKHDVNNADNDEDRLTVSLGDQPKSEGKNIMNTVDTSKDFEVLM